MINTNVDSNGILIITLNRVEKLNALNQDVLNALSEQFSAAQNNNAIKAILLTGEGKAFCAGADINRLLTANAISGHEFAVEGQRVFRQLETLGKPSLAAVNGFAFGGGCVLASARPFHGASFGRRRQHRRAGGRRSVSTATHVRKKVPYPLCLSKPYCGYCS